MNQATLDKRPKDAMPLYRRLVQAMDGFFLTPASARPLGALRIGIAAVLIVQALMLRREIFDFFAHDGIVQGKLAEYLSVPNTPRIAWLVGALSPLGVSETSCIYTVCGVYFASLVMLAAGYRTRIAATVAWLLHWVLINTGYTIIYGVDQYAHIFLFYLIWVPSGNAYSVDVTQGRASATPTPLARLGLRVLQVHLCISYFASGLEKLSGEQWRSGELIWRVLSMPIYQQFDASWLAEWPLVPKLACWATIAVELGYCVLIWPKRTRKLWIAATLALHMGIAVFMGLHLFGLIMCVFTLAVFGVSPEPRERPASAQ